MLELRPNCELCDADLPPESPLARICSYECTYCVDCAEGEFADVCPTCGGNLTPRPIRPARAYRATLSLGREHHPSSGVRRHSRWSIAERTELIKRLQLVAPQDR